MPHAFIVDGTGQIGRATAACLIDSGWSVTLAHRGLRSPPSALIERGAKVVRLDRGELSRRDRICRDRRPDLQLAPSRD